MTLVAQLGLMKRDTRTQMQQCEAMPAMQKQEKKGGNKCVRIKVQARIILLDGHFWGQQVR
jgi:hypothetical protein